VAVKADGLARGKGVIICSSVSESDAAINAMLVESRFGRSGATIVVEELLEGPELSILGITDGKDVVALAPARDFKRASDGDQGLNTGGMGAYSPPNGVDDAAVKEVVDRVLLPAVRELAEGGDEFRGVLYAGVMLTPDGIRTLEFNARLATPKRRSCCPACRPTSSRWPWPRPKARWPTFPTCGGTRNRAWESSLRPAAIPTMRRSKPATRSAAWPRCRLEC